MTRWRLPIHLRTALKDTPLWASVCGVLERGGVVAAVGASASAMCDPMTDPRGGAFTFGLGLSKASQFFPNQKHGRPNSCSAAPRYRYRSLNFLRVRRSCSIEVVPSGFVTAVIRQRRLVAPASKRIQAVPFHQPARRLLLDLHTPTNGIERELRGWSMNEVAPERNLNDRAITFWNVDIARRIIAAQCVKPDSVDRSDCQVMWMSAGSAPPHSTTGVIT